MAAGVVPVLLACLPLAVWLFVMLRPGVTVSSRTIPANAAWIGVMVVFVAYVNPWWGLCAALAAWHWLWRGWQLIEGFFLWPVCAAAALIGTHASQPWLDAAICLALAIGVLEVIVAAAQYCRLPLLLIIRPSDGQPEIFGTIGHRTGLGAYLALLIPLSFLSSWGPALTGIYAIGLLLSRSNVAIAAGFIGFLWVAPGVWWVALPAAVLGFVYRSVEFEGWRPAQWRHMGDTWKARKAVWKATFRHLPTRPFPPAWLIGRGSFALDCRTWQIAGTDGKDRPHLPLAVHTGEMFREAHNDFVEHAYEYGALGCLAMAGWLWSLRGAFGWHDPLTGALLALAITMAGSFPIRVAPILGVAGLVIISLMRRAM